VARAGGLPLRWAHRLRYRESASFDHSRLRWYRDATRTYRLTAHALVPAILRAAARLTVDGLENMPLSGPVILAANHRDNLDGFLLLHLLPRTIHVAARADGFGTGGLCAIWRRLGAFPADAWGMRHALSLLADDGVVALFVQGMISTQLETTRGAVGLLALHSGAPVVPVAISGTEAVHVGRLFTRRADISVRFGPPLTFARSGHGSPRSLAVADDILQHIAALLPEAPRMTGLHDKPRHASHTAFISESVKPAPAAASRRRNA
jgi:1-acyl-sn-glycerol-3-phosphate acyltransferase